MKKRADIVVSHFYPTINLVAVNAAADTGVKPPEVSVAYQIVSGDLREDYPEQVARIASAKTTALSTSSLVYLGVEKHLADLAVESLEPGLLAAARRKEANADKRITRLQTIHKKAIALWKQNGCTATPNWLSKKIKNVGCKQGMIRRHLLDMGWTNTGPPDEPKIE